jgi:hypothetical protein
MQKLTLILFTILIASNSFGQRKENKVFEGSKGKWEIPLPKYSNLSDNYTKRYFCSTTCNGMLDSTLIITTDSAYDVKALHKGKVILVSEIDNNSFIVMVKFGDYYLTYTSIGEVFVKKDEEVIEGQKIGRVVKNLDAIYELDIYLSKKDKDLCAKNWIDWNQNYCKRKLN